MLCTSSVGLLNWTCILFFFCEDIELFRDNRCLSLFSRFLNIYDRSQRFLRNYHRENSSFRIII